MGDCPFCGAHCTEDRRCECEGYNQKMHNTRFHRPMAFLGSHDIEFLRPDKNKRTGKSLLDDHCLSQRNLKICRWPDPSEFHKEKFAMLERLNKPVEIKTKGINITLEWKTGDDLDTPFKCG